MTAMLLQGSLPIQFLLRRIGVFRQPGEPRPLFGVDMVRDGDAYMLKLFEIIAFGQDDLYKFGPDNYHRST